MKIVFIINSIATEKCRTSVYSMTEAHKRGHQVFIATVEDFSFDSNSKMSINCVYLPKTLQPKHAREFLDLLQSNKIKKKKLAAQDIDVVFLRNNPTEEESGRSWAEHSGIAFGRMIQQQGVLVLNDAFGLSNAFVDKLYFEELPEEIKPKSIVTRNKKEIMEFYEKHKNRVVLKPLEGSGGQDVYLIDKRERNLNQIITSISQHGYVIAQEYLPAGKDGDVRVMLLNGKVLEMDGKYGIVRRVNSKGEFRSNLSLGAKPEITEYTEEMKHIVDLVSPKIIKDGLFLVGLDIVKDKLIEINVLSPGGLDAMEEVGLPDFSPVIIDAIERKIKYKKIYLDKIPNQILATMD